MSKRDNVNLIRNVYDDSTIDTLRALDQNIIALMHHNPDFKNIEINYYERMPIKTGSSESHIRVDVSKNEKHGFFYLKEDFINRLEESEQIRKELSSVMKQIKMSLSE